MRLSVDRTELELRPGSPARLTAEVHNTGDAAQMVGFTVDLPGTAWASTAQPVVRVSRAETVFVSVDLDVGMDVTAGQHDLVLWVRSHLDPSIAAAQRIRITVTPVPGPIDRGDDGRRGRSGLCRCPHAGPSVQPGPSGPSGRLAGRRRSDRPGEPVTAGACPGAAG